ncbi:MAG: hypothetical protein NTW87_11995 [Planctomycetota bacterium]|nr:hypothetical protein [Planctomycetota bacterium]
MYQTGQPIPTGAIAVCLATLLSGIVLFLSLGAASAADAIPYPDALSAAAVTEDKISNIGGCGLVVGNGELNAIVYAMGNDIRLRIGKNDCWDLRVDTENDPPMATINPATGKVANSHGPAGSWNKPYPTALPCGEVVLGAGSQSRITSATLDLAKAVATVKTGDRSVEVRVLSQSNVILLHSDQTLSFLGTLEFLKDKNIDTWISKADLGSQGGYQYLHQNIPGDKDMSGMDIYMVAGKRDSTQAIAVVTSRDVQQPLDAAVAIVAKTLAENDAVAKHEEAWRQFWSKSGLQLGDKELQNWWYRMLYFFRVFSRSGGNAIGLAACFDHLAGWHNSLKLNYNIQQTYLAAGPVGHPELLEPFIDVLTRDLPRGRWFAKTSFVGAEGAFFFSDFYPFEPDPAKCQTKWQHQQTYMPWGYTWGMAGHSAVVVWDYYKFAPTAEHLERVYPLIKEFGLFYCSVLEQCALVDGKRRIGPSYFPELGGFNEFNVCYDIHFITAALKIAREAAALKGEADFVKRLDANIAQLPGYGTQPDPDQGNQTVIEQWAGCKFGEGGADRHGTLIQGIFPASIINWFSSNDLKELGKRTINRVETCTTHANSNVSINIARARLGLGDEAVANAKMCFSGTPNGKYSKEQPNGFFNWNAHGYYMTEQVAIARFVTELLLQSVSDVIRIFPAWPGATDAHFTDLLAQGGFMVSADQVGGTISNVKIRSTVGGTARLVSPWANQGLAVVEQGSNAVIPVTRDGGIASFPTTAGRTYILSSGR